MIPRAACDVREECFLSPCNFNVYTDGVMKVKKGVGRLEMGSSEKG